MWPQPTSAGNWQNPQGQGHHKVIAPRGIIQRIYRPPIGARYGITQPVTDSTFLEAGCRLEAIKASMTRR
ncbi:hypothetical protein B1757_13865 [Acidithiobacillus marinus]|uniref:Uncharacterized protein n=1 Tax=Acidithiobacillus marinus TaxID=187490 RepID=A0A2I1DIJ6_9PROT|nr:hypothetical protein B1757_13865 [Acidithiobacillus marinus]